MSKEKTLAIVWLLGWPLLTFLTPMYLEIKETGAGMAIWAALWLGVAAVVLAPSFFEEKEEKKVK